MTPFTLTPSQVILLQYILNELSNGINPQAQHSKPIKVALLLSPSDEVEIQSIQRQLRRGVMA